MQQSAEKARTKHPPWKLETKSPSPFTKGLASAESSIRLPSGCKQGPGNLCNAPMWAGSIEVAASDLHQSDVQ
eukprot:4592496-Amphidinium_carterae.1